MTLLYVFKERAPIFIEFARRISLSANRLVCDARSETEREAVV